MINNVFLDQIKKYDISNIVRIKNAIKEVLQNIILCGLGKSDFFKYVAFYGGTSLRIFRNLPRFSEDLDFTLITNEKDFDFDYYLMTAKKELDSMMIESEIYDKEKRNETSVLTRFFRFNMKHLFSISFPKYQDKIINNEILLIKVEVETAFVSGGVYEMKLLTYPTFTQVRTFSFETLFASKLMAVLNRKWKSRIKGRDFYDYLFYISKEVKVNMEFLESGLKKFGYLEEKETLSLDRLKKDLKERFESLNYDEAIHDLSSFVNDNDPYLSAFKKEIFLGTLDLIKCD